MGKTDEDKLGKLVAELIKDVGSDRNRLSDFLDSLINMVDSDPEAGVNPAQIAEHVAKIAAELTRQNQIKVATIKALGKAIPEDDDDEDGELVEEIGRPFPEEVDEGSN